jgi:hypothetical protein
MEEVDVVLTEPINFNLKVQVGYAEKKVSAVGSSQACKRTRRHAMAEIAPNRAGPWKVALADTIVILDDVVI